MVSPTNAGQYVRIDMAFLHEQPNALSILGSTRLECNADQVLDAEDTGRDRFHFNITRLIECFFRQRIAGKSGFHACVFSQAA